MVDTKVSCIKVDRSGVTSSPIILKKLEFHGAPFSAAFFKIILLIY